MKDPVDGREVPLNAEEQKIFAQYEDVIGRIVERAGRPNYALIHHYQKPKTVSDIYTAVSLDVDRLIDAGDWDDVYELTRRHLQAETEIEFSKFSLFFPDDPNYPEGPGIIRLDLGVTPESEQ